jgi:hypothetical protein
MPSNRVSSPHVSKGQLGYKKLNHTDVRYLALIPVNVALTHVRATDTRYLNFSVVKLNNANNTATITNLKTIFGSFHPEISK